MIYVDDRSGSGHLAGPLREVGLQVQETRLPAADFMLYGNGPGGAAVKVGVELKRISDFVGSWHSGRFAGTQLPKMQRRYYDSWLLIEGDIRDSAFYMTSSEYDGYLISMRVVGGINVKETRNQGETVEFLKTLHGWWTGKDYDQHKAHLAIDRSIQGLVPMRNPVRDFYARIPGVGYTRAESLLRVYPKPVDLATAYPAELWKVPGIGPKLADRIWKFFKEGK